MNPAPLTPELRAAAPALGAALGAILSGLAALIARAFLRNPLRVGLIVPLWTRLKRAAGRADRLMARVVRGAERPRPACPGRQRRPAAAPAPARPGAQLPRTHAWLLTDLKHEAALYTNRLDRLLCDPANAALVAHIPQLASLLRPLCRMLGVRNPAVPPLPRHREPPAPPAASGTSSTRPASATSMLVPQPQEPERCPHLDRWPFVPWQPRHAT